MLHVTEHGAPASLPLLIVHGLFGSGRNWGVIARRLSDERYVLTPDMRNHGDSPHHENHGYPDLAEDLAELIAVYGGQVDLVGHSMGGKAAMALALTRPDMVRRLIVADIAPVRYDHSQMHNIDAMRSVDLSSITRRSDAIAQLAPHVTDKALQSFFTQSLDIANRRWKYNLDALAREMPKILSFPDLAGSYSGETLFLTGAQSDYVRPEHRPQIRTLFPKARFAKLQGAGHWLHADNPRGFEASLRAFLPLPDSTTPL